MNENMQPKIELNNGVKIPQLGLGVWKSTIEDASKAVQAALHNGYVLIDTAKQYGNEKGVGDGIQAAMKNDGLKRDNIFLTTKIFNGDQGDYDHVRQAFEEQLKNLQTDHVDLLLEHWPVDDKYNETWRAMEAILKDGQARAIGVSNFDNGRLIDLMDHGTVVPAVNQIEFNPNIHQKAIVDFDRQQGIHVEAWSPLGSGTLLKNPVVKKIADAHHKSTAQVELRWGLQHGMIEIAKTIHEQRMKENMDIFDFELTPEEMNAIDGLNQEKHALWYHDFQWNGNPDGVGDYVATPDHW